MVEGKGFHANPKHQYRVSQCGEHDFSGHNKEKGDYFEFPSLSYSSDEH